MPGEVDIKELLDQRLEAEKESGSIIEQDLEGAKVEDAPDFFNAREPSYTLKAERPEHRVICYLAAEGNTRSEIAQKTGFTPTTIGYVEKQPWARELITKIIRSRGGDKVEMVLRGAAVEAAEFLVETIKDPEAPRNVRYMCAKETLDRLYGRSQQVIQSINASPDDLTDEQLARCIKASETN